MHMKKVFIIAEAGDNHNGDINLAYKLIDVAKESGADAVKFQTFITEDIICKDAEMAKYQKVNTGVEESQFEMVKRLELSFDEFKKLKKYADKKGIKFLTTGFDKKSVRFISNELKLDMLKIPSGEITNYPYLVECAKTKLPVILSTGMCELKEIKEAVKVLKKNGTPKIIVLHCTTEYPAPLESVNLLAMKTLKEEFGFEVGYSDHTKGIEVPCYAVAMGATVIEKHFTIDKNLPGPDHKASLEPQELKEMVEKIREVELILGDGDKKPQNAEKANIPIARKSIVAACEIKQGEKFTEENLACKRPGDGMNPMLWKKVVGKKDKKDFKKDEKIEL